MSLVLHPETSNMISQFEVSAYLANNLPEIRTELRNTYPTLNIFKSIQCLVNHTRGKLIEHDIQAVKNCLAVAEYIYARGNKLVKNAIENIFVYSFSSLLNASSHDEKRQIQNLMPLHLYSAYVQQGLKPGS